MRRTTRGHPFAPYAAAVSALLMSGLGALAVAGCSPSTAAPQIDSDRRSASDGPTGTTATATSPGVARVAGGELADRVRAAMAAAGSARFALQSSTTSGPDATGALAVKAGSVRVRFDFTDGTDRLRVISFPGVLYADVGEVVDGRHWLKVTAGGTDPLSSAMAPLLSYMTNSADVSSQTSSWAAATTFTVHPGSSVSGRAATEYDGTIPRAAVQAGLPAQFREVMRKDITGDSHLRLWLDAQDRPLKVVTAGSYDGKPDLVTVTYSDWGRAPAVTAPPESDVIRSRS